MKQAVGTQVVKQVVQYLGKDPERNVPRAVDMLMPFAQRGHMQRQLLSVKKIMSEPENNYHGLVLRAFSELAPKVRNQFVANFVYNSAMVGNATALKMKSKYDCNVPWAILMDPTSACNLHCTGCWAAEYSKKDAMDFDTLDSIITQGKALGIYFYIYSGGEPTMRKKDIIELARKHDDCVFLAFTNGTLVDDAFVNDLVDVGNFALAFSIEGFEDATDFRRGNGTYQKVIEAMDRMKKAGAPFGFSACYHSKNIESVGSDAFLDFLVEKGCMFGWYFTYMPLGKDANLDLIARPEQREYMFHWVRRMREEKPIFLLDFWNDGQYVDGCIAGGKSYLHINAAGDVEPCAFIHYSNVNIHDVSLIDALRSPIFQAYRKRQPFNANQLKPCPLLDNPQMLRDIVHEAGAHSTQPVDEEDVDELAAKCDSVSANWTPVADKLWAGEEQKYKEAKAVREKENEADKVVLGVEDAK
ncbi:MAG: radical SAM protein [Spirochaetaceae bacterium]|nr:radical SAM protein [Spirochaetaceae bacterium]